MSVRKNSKIKMWLSVEKTVIFYVTHYCLTLPLILRKEKDKMFSSKLNINPLIIFKDEQLFEIEYDQVLRNF